MGAYKGCVDQFSARTGHWKASNRQEPKVGTPDEGTPKGQYLAGGGEDYLARDSRSLIIDHRYLTNELNGADL